MSRGGARKGAGRKPKPLAEKLSAGNPGHRPLKKLEFAGKSGNQIAPPEYLADMEKADHAGKVPSPASIFEDTVEYLEPSKCLNLIPPQLLADYALAKYYLICAQYQLSLMPIVGQNSKKEIVVTSFTEAMLKMQKNVLSTWEPIWDIVSRNSERFVTNPEQDLIAILIGGRSRKKPKGEPPDDGYAQYAEDSGFEAEPGEV